jgi:hypothetical protein
MTTETVVRYYVEDYHGQTLGVYDTIEEAEAVVDFDKEQVINFKRVRK